MKLRCLSLVIALALLSACAAPPVPTLTLPGQSSPTAAAESTASPALPAVTETLPPPAPAVEPSPTLTPSPAPTATPAPIDSGSVSQLRPVAIYPLFRRGLLKSILWSPDGQNLAVETSLGLQVLSVPDLHKRFNLPDTRALYFLKDGSLLIYAEEKLSLLDLAGGDTRPLAVQPELVNNRPAPYALSLDETYWAASVDGSEVQIQNLQTGEQAAVKPVSRTNIALTIEELTFSPDGSRLFVLVTRKDNQRELVAFETGSWKQLYETFNAHSLPVFSPDGARMIYDQGGRILMDLTETGKNWNSLASRTSKKVTQQEQSILSAAGYGFINSNNKIGVIFNGELSDSRSQQTKYIPAAVMIYDIDTAKIERYINDLPARVEHFAFSPNGETFLTAAKDGVIKLWQTSNGALITSSEPYDTDPAPGIRADGKMAAYAGEESILLVDPFTSQVTGELGEYPGALRLQAKFIASDRLAIFVETSWRRFIDTWDIPSGKFLFRYPDLGSCDFSRSGTLMYCSEGVIKFFDMPTGRALLDLVPQRGIAYAFSQDGNRVASCTPGSEFIYVWEVRLGSVPKYTLGGKAGSCGNSLAFSPDGEKLASSSGYYWKVTSGELLSTFEAAGSGPAEIGPGGDVLLVYPNLVNLLSGETLSPLQTVPDLKGIYFQPDGVHLVLLTRRGIEFWTTGQ